MPHFRDSCGGSGGGGSDVLVNLFNWSMSKYQGQELPASVIKASVPMIVTHCAIYQWLDRFDQCDRDIPLHELHIGDLQTVMAPPLAYQQEDPCCHGGAI